MKTATIAVLASAAALASAQATYNSTTGKFDCAEPNVAYCAGDSMETDIIIRCNSKGVGQQGRCSDNLAGEPPIGDSIAMCWTSSADAGDAACEKNCVVYGASGNYNGTFTLSDDECNGVSTSTASAGSSSTTSSATAITTDSGTSSGTTTVAPTTTTSTSVPANTGTGSGGSSSVNGTSSTGNGSGSGTSATNTPVSPTTTTGTAGTAATGTATGTSTGSSAVATAGASSVKSVGSMFAVLGLAAAYLL